MILKKVSCVYLNWVQLAQDRDKNWAVTKSVMNFGVSYIMVGCIDYLRKFWVLEFGCATWSWFVTYIDI